MATAHWRTVAPALILLSMVQTSSRTHSLDGSFPMAPVVSTAPRGPAVDLIRGSDLEPSHFQEIFAILIAEWRDADPYLYDISRVIRNCADDMLIRISEGRIDGVLRTKRIRTEGNPARIPRTLELLVGPYWARRESQPDTRILVDLTKLEGAGGVAKSLVPACLDRFSEPNIATFSPEDAAGLHIHFGAYPLRRIENARPRHSPPHVTVMCYRGFVSNTSSV